MAAPRALGMSTSMSMSVTLLCLMLASAGPRTARGTSADDVAAMKAALRNKGDFNVFLDLLEREENQTQFANSRALNFLSLTVFAPVDSAFEKFSPGNYHNFRCWDPTFAPDGCVVPIVQFHLVRQKLSFSDLIAAEYKATWDTVEGASIQKFKGKKRFNFAVGPQRYGDGPLSAKVFRSYILQPEVYTSLNITVHSLDSVMPPPDSYQTGFTYVKGKSSGTDSDDNPDS